MALLLILDRYSGHTHFTYAYLGNNKIWTDMLFMLTFTANGLADRFIIAGISVVCYLLIILAEIIGQGSMGYYSRGVDVAHCVV